MITIEEVQANSELMNDFIEENMGLVKMGIKKAGIPLTEDFLQEGAIGLLKAARRFDISRGLAFSTYAVPLIIGQARRYNRDYASGDMVSGMNVSRDLKAIFFKSLKYEGYEDTEICKELNITLQELEEAHMSMKSCMSLDKDSHNNSAGDKSTEIYEFIPSKENVEDDVINKLSTEELMEYVKIEFGEQALKALNLYLSGEFTQSQIGKQIGKSQVNVSRLLYRIARSYNRRNKGGYDMKITTEQLLNECREHGTGIKALELIAEKYDMAVDSVRNSIARKDIKKMLSDEYENIQKYLSTDTLSNQIKQQVKIVEVRKQAEPVIWQEDKVAKPSSNIKAWGGKENIYSFQGGKLVISNKEGALAVTDFKAMIQELQELAAKNEAV